MQQPVPELDDENVQQTTEFLNDDEQEQEDFDATQPGNTKNQDEATEDKGQSGDEKKGFSIFVGNLHYSVRWVYWNVGWIDLF